MLHLPHTRRDFPGLFRHIQFLKLLPAIGTALARPHSLLPKITQYILPETVFRQTVVYYALQPFFVPLPDCPRLLRCKIGIFLFAVQQKTVNHQILCRIQQNTLRRFPVAPCAPRFLIVIFYTLGHIVMNDIANIRLVNSHPKRICRHHHQAPFINKILLVLLTFHISKPCMVFRYGYPLRRKSFKHSVHIFPRCTVDNPALILVPCHIIQNIRILFPYILHRKVQIFPVKSSYQNLWLRKSQYTLNILFHRLRSRGRKCADNRTFRHLLDKLHNFQVAWPEILPPLRDAVCLIHRHHTNISIFCKCHKRRSFQPFRSHINNLIPSICRIIHRFGNLIFRQRAVNVSCVDSCLI